MDRYWKNNLYMLRLIWNISKNRVLIEFLSEAIDYASWVFYSIVFVSFLMRSLEVGRSFIEIMSFLIFGATLMGIFIVFRVWYDTVFKPNSNAVIYGNLNKKLFDKASEVELSCYEDTEFYNQFTLAMKDSEEKINSILETGAAITSGLVAGLFSLYYMFSIDHFVIIFVLGPIIGNFVFGKKLNQKIFQQNKENVPNIRKMDYVNRVMYLADYAKELRMSHIFNVLKVIYEEGFSGVILNIRKYALGKINLSIWRNMFTFFVIFQGVIFYSLYRVLVTHSITLSDFVVLFSAMNTVAWILIGLSKQILNSYQNSLYIANFRNFLEYTPTISEKQEGNEANINFAKGEAEVSFRNVSFAYRGQKVPTLKNINITIHHKEKIAIVGHNGAGKTTFIKLLMRLYDPTEGDVVYHGEDVKELHLAKYRRLYATAFQDYQVFSMTVAENVLMGKPENKKDYELVKNALIEAGVWDKVKSLSNGMDTTLTKEFDEKGAVLSGGELQKIAVARAFAKDHSIAIFDEPSSALDPIAEYKLYQSIMKACEEKTVIFISHRLSSAVLADRIYLFENGEIVEQGTHEELIKQQGLYANMFQKQAERYKGGMKQ